MQAQPRMSKFYKTKRFYLIVVGLSALILIPTFVYYSMGYNSVKGTVSWIVDVRRVAGYPSVVYYITIGVGSWSASVDVQVTDPKFSLVINSFPVGTVSDLSQTVKPYGQIQYNLAFQTTEDTEYYIGYSSPHSVSISMAATMNGGWYQQQFSQTDSGTWTFST